jgi:sec-independent protein translocase protein TatA
MDLGAPELLIILVIGLLIFGSNRLPKLARSLGQASREFKSVTSPGWIDDQVNPPAPAAAATPAPATPTTPASTEAASPAPEPPPSQG